MPGLIIPEQYRSGLSALRALSEAQLSNLTDALSSIPETARTGSEVASAVVSHLREDFPADKADQIVRTLHSLYHVRALGDLDSNEFVGDLANAMSASGSAELVLANKEEYDRFVGIINALLGIHSLSFLAKANALQRDHEHIFHDAKILTDLRPVFHEPDQEPQDIILEYTLKIVFHDGFRHKELYMTMDANDMSTLRSAIERAEKKGASLRSLLQSKGLKQLPSLGEIR